MGDALTAATPVAVPRWQRRKRAAQALEAAHTERVEYRGLDTRGRLVRRVTERVVVPEDQGPLAQAVEVSEHLAAQGTALEALLATEEQQGAMRALAALPVRERVAVAGPLGLLREGVLGDRLLAQHLRCSAAEVLQLRERGLQRLRRALGGECPS
ncbi:MAG: hypothetical protein ACJ8AT_06140 [Hyalangium sp.]|uniref:hypothetical protein n=1 Tax=Hyalangium sp. TaxID=2028555 RepID=UPI00389A7CDD